MNYAVEIAEMIGIIGLGTLMFSALSMMNTLTENGIHTKAGLFAAMAITVMGCASFVELVGKVQ